MVNITYDPRKSFWQLYNEPYATISAENEKDLLFLQNRKNKEIPQEPLGADLHKKVNGNIHQYLCPVCKNFLAGRGAIKEAKRNCPNYCLKCGQKLDWGDIN